MPYSTSPSTTLHVITLSVGVSAAERDWVRGSALMTSLKAVVSRR